MADSLPSYEDVVSGKALPSYAEVMSGHQAGAMSYQGAKAAYEQGQPDASFQPDQSIGAGETAFRTARNQALMGFGEQAVEAASRGIAKLNPFISKQQYQETFANQPIGEASKPAQVELQAGQSANPGGELLGTGLGEAAGWAASEGAMRGALMALKPVKAAASAMGELIGSSFEGVAAKVASKVPKLTPKWVDKVGGEKAVQELGQFLNDSGVTNTVGTTRQVMKRITNVKEAIGEDIGKVWAKAGTKASSFAMDENALIQSTSKYIEEASQAAKQAVPDSLVKDVAEELSKYKGTLFNAEGQLNMAGAKSVIKTLETQSGKFLKSNEAKSSFLDLVADGMRSTLKDEVKVFLPEAEAKTLDTLNRQYVLAKTAYRGIKAKLNESLVSQFIKKGIGVKVGGYVGEKLGGEEGKTAGEAIGFGATTTVGKTAASAILRMIPELGSYGKTLLKIAHQNGIDALLARHAYMYMNNKDYREEVNSLGGVRDQETAQLPTQ